MPPPDFEPPDGGLITIDTNGEYLVSVAGSEFTAVIDVASSLPHKPKPELAGPEAKTIDVRVGGRATVKQSGSWVIQIEGGKKVTMEVAVASQTPHKVSPEFLVP